MLQDKIVIITGATKGIGFACARKFASKGAKIILTSRKDEELLNERVSEINENYPDSACGFLADAGDYQEVKKLYSFVLSKYKRLDVLVNNAGIMETSLLGMMDIEKVNRMFHSNVYSVIWNMQFAYKLMSRNKKGSIINIASIMGTRGSAGQIVYSGTKSAVIGMTYAAAKEFANMGIRVNAVAPGFIDTDMIKQLSEEKYLETIKNIKMNRIGTPEEVAYSVMFFASEKSNYITGQVLGVDGGMII